MLILSINEEVFGSDQKREFNLSFANETITLAALIQAKSKKEIELTNQRLKDNLLPANHSWFKKEERLLNESTIRKQGLKAKEQLESLIVDEEKAGYDALAAFQANAFFVIVDGQQKLDLEEELILSKNSKVQFVRLTPLVGG